MVDVAQLVRALDCGSRGRRFKSGLPPKQRPPNLAASYFFRFYKFPKIDLGDFGYWASYSTFSIFFVCIPSLVFNTQK